MTSSGSAKLGEDASLKTDHANHGALTPELTRKPWSLTRQWLLRFAVLYFALFIIPFVFGAVLYRPWTPAIVVDLASAYSGVVLTIGEWVGCSLLGIEAEIWPGSERPGLIDLAGGDRIGAWIMIPVNMLFAACIATLWSALARKTIGHPLLARTLMHTCRLFLAFVLGGYAMAKVFPTQFPAPSSAQMLTEYGDLPHVQIMWNFMGTSPVYQMFGGWAELAAAILLLFRRTQTLGALTAAAVLANVAAMNFAYMIMVKIVVCHYLVMAIGIALVDWRRLLCVFIINRPTNSVWARHSDRGDRACERSANRRGLRWAMWTGETALIALIAYTSIVSIVITQLQAEDAAGREFSGLYDVQSFIVNGHSVPPLRTDGTRWRNLMFEYGVIARIRMMDDRFGRYMFVADESAGTLLLKDVRDDESAAELRYDVDNIGGLHLTGTIGADSVEIHLTRRDPNDFALRRRGFNWIQDQPFNR